MASSSPLGLPPISPQLRSITPYLQRAQEVRKQDPVVAYWCAYYAAQLGISLKVRDSASRDVLFALLGTLERMKTDIGSNEAVDIESVSAAHVENFALKVFALADDEDRSGNATRSTAKKFLAAANFLEILKTISKLDIAEATSEKIKYAKWKAADIAKAFREGRRPTPGPSGLDLQEDPAPTPPASPPPAETPFIPFSSPRPDPPVKYSSPPAQFDVPTVDHDAFTAEPRTPPPHVDSYRDGSAAEYGRHARWESDGKTTPGSWSTAATSGTTHPPSSDLGDQASPSRIEFETTRDRRPRSRSDSTGVDDVEKSQRARLREELDPGSPQYSVSRDNRATVPSVTGTTDDDGFKKFVHFAPSTNGSSSPTSPFTYDEREQGGGRDNWSDAAPVPYEALPLPLQRPTILDANVLPPGFVPDPHQVWHLDASVHEGPYHLLPHISAPAPTHDISGQESYGPGYHSNPPPALTPTLIAKVQKHCRFAISALDYEDAEQAKKDLRAALALLGE